MRLSMVVQCTSTGDAKPAFFIELNSLWIFFIHFDFFNALDLIQEIEKVCSISFSNVVSGEETAFLKNGERQRQIQPIPHCPKRNKLEVFPIQILQVTLDKKIYHLRTRSDAWREQMLPIHQSAQFYDRFGRVGTST
jgi:hypothetical protein